MDTYTIVRKNGDWSTVPVLHIDKWYNSEPMAVSATAQVCYDDEALYVRMQAVEEEIKAEYTGLLEEVSDDSCLEFFFSPMAGDRRYFNIEINFNGAMYLGFGPSITHLMRLIPEEMKFERQATKTPDGWMLEYAIPYEFIRVFFPEFSPAPGCEMRGNFFKGTGAGDKPHFLCWQMVVARRCSFHNPDCFGRLVFE